ncbi:hypothetical protein F5Y16DRAFT_383763 [Xylariaceae sp. FL0255]|nr:hypothetical protein F5Y16DRAFT_383763 [Xylariaceae sp. FL0255]
MMYISTPKAHRSLARLALRHAYTVWLFTFSDLKTIVVPSIVFGLTNASAAPLFHLPTIEEHGIVWLSRRAPWVAAWIWLNLLPFNINNQRTDSAIMEDRINKPWRPMPSDRISYNWATFVMLVAYVMAHGVSIYLHCGTRQAVALVVLGVWYNNFGGADSHPIIRNIINALGYLCFISGALEVATSRSLLLTSKDSILLQWLGVIAAIVATTVHTQDMYDQEGDALRGRLTVPIAIGDFRARWTIALWMVIWGLACPYFWGLGYVPRVLSCGLAMTVAFRTLTFRNVASDKKTFVIWVVWKSLIYTLPMWKRNET